MMRGAGAGIPAPQGPRDRLARGRKPGLSEKGATDRTDTGVKHRESALARLVCPLPVNQVTTGAGRTVMKMTTKVLSDQTMSRRCAGGMSLV
ncbi:MAG: hypothetical protein D6720_10135 [Gammaproteobacteria bacterium]|nr:MAG: hypothetical protein D6720_10135 [Gammaproteobacteria bacterium]